MISPFPKQALVFTCLQYKSFENTVGKGEITHNEQFLFPHCFLPFLENFLPFSSNLNLSSPPSFSWKSLKSVVWKRVKGFSGGEGGGLLLGSAFLSGKIW